jgi:hypothetical protein
MDFMPMNTHFTARRLNEVNEFIWAGGGLSGAESLALNASGTWTLGILRNPLTTKQLESWRRGESEYSAVLKTRKLLTFRDAGNAEDGKIAANWNVSGTRDFQFSWQFCEVFLERKKISNRANRLTH